MPAFFLAFLSVALATMAGRDAMRVARLAGAGVAPSLLLVAIALAAAGFAALSAAVGEQIAPVLNEKGKLLIAAIALAVAALEVLVMRPGKTPKEPTLSVFAIALVLFAALLLGASGLLVVAITLVTGEVWLAGAGGAAGAFAALTLPALTGALWAKKAPQAALRWTTGGILALAAVLTGLPIFVPLF